MDTSMQPLAQRFYTLLRWSEKYMKTDMVYLATGGFWLSIGTIVTAISSFILSIAFANLLPPEAYGVYKYALSVAAIFGAFTLTGLETAVTYAASRGFEGVLKRAFSTNLWWSIPSSTAALGVAVYYLAQENISLGVAFVVIALAQPLTVSANYGAAYLNGKKAFRALATFYTVDNLTPALVLIGVMMITKSALWVLVAYFLSNLITTVVMYYYVLRQFTPNTSEDPDSITYGKHLSAMSILANVADNFDKILTFHFLGAAQLAIYSFALALPLQSKLITKSLGNLLFPKFAARESEEIRQSMGEKVLRFFILGLVMTVGYIIVAPLIFKLFYPAYLNAVFLSQLFALSLLGLAFSPMGTYLSAKRKVRAQYILNIAVSVFQLASAVVGMLLWGLFGLILSRVATRFVGGFLSALFYYTDL